MLTKPLTVRGNMLLIALITIATSSFAQTGNVASQPLPGQQLTGASIAGIDRQYERLASHLHKQSVKLLKRLQKKEARLYKQLQASDSAKAAALFSNASPAYQRLQQQLQTAPDTGIVHPLKEYIPVLDSLQTAVKFLEKSPGLPAAKLQQLTQTGEHLHALQGKLQNANEIQQFIQQREQQLKEALGTMPGFEKQLKGLNQQVYYYQQRLAGYKAMLNDSKKLEQQLLATVRELPAFQQFLQKHSYLAQLFGMPAGEDGLPSAALQGLQTRTEVQTLLQQRLGAVGGAAGMGTAGQYAQQQLQQAQTLMNKLQEKVNKWGGGGNMTMPDFKPDQQKTKPFLQRLEYSVNLQMQGTTNFLPSTADIALLLGYKLKDGIATGAGIAYKLGLGRGWNHIDLTHQGIGLRSYVDIKAKGSIWISGGYEYQYMKAFENVNQLKKLHLWQKSALLGVTKKYRIGRKKEGRMQLLYDFLSSRQRPQGQALKFRIGYNL